MNSEKFLLNFIQFLIGLVILMVTGLVCMLIYHGFVTYGFWKFFLGVICLVAGVKICVMIGRRVFKLMD